MIQKHELGLLGFGSNEEVWLLWCRPCPEVAATDNLSKTLQNPSLSSSEAQCVADLTVITLSSIRSNEAFWLFWQSLIIRLKEVNIDEPQLPHRRKVPARFEIGTSEGSHPSIPEDLYRLWLVLSSASKTGLTSLVPNPAGHSWLFSIAFTGSTGKVIRGRYTPETF